MLLIENAGGIFSHPADLCRESGKWRATCLMAGMATRFVEIDRDTAMLLPPDLRDWVPANHLVHS